MEAHSSLNMKVSAFGPRRTGPRVFWEEAEPVDTHRDVVGVDVVGTFVVVHGDQLDPTEVI